MTPLERRFERLLLLYPKTYRSDRGQEILATVVESADPGRHWPTPTEVTDLARHALRRRVGLGGDQPAGSLAARAAPAGLFMASVLAVVSFVFGEWAPWQSAFDPHHFGPFYTTGPVIYAGWLAAGVSQALGRPRLARVAAALSVSMTVACLPVSHVLHYGRPPLPVLATLVALGATCLLAPPPEYRRSGEVIGRDWVSRAILGVAGMTALVIAVAPAAWVRPNSRAGFYWIGLRIVAGQVPGLAAIALIVAVTFLVIGRPAVSAMIAVLTFPWLILTLSMTRAAPGLRDLSLILAVALAAVTVTAERAESVQDLAISH